MHRFQAILLSLLVFVYLPISAVAADKVGAALNEMTSIGAELVVKENDHIMLRRVQPIAGLASLSVAEQEISATFLEETLGEPHGAIVFFHDQGEELESQGVVTPLRHGMLQYGWSTLTLRLDYPFTPNILLTVDPETKVSAEIAPSTSNTNSEAVVVEANTTDTDLVTIDDTNNNTQLSLPAVSNKQRIEAAIAFLEAKDIKRIIFLGHGRGGIVALQEFITPSVSALILVGTPALTNNDEFKAFEQPILDIYGKQDLAGVAVAVNQRKAVMKRIDNILYTSREIMGANHVFYGLEPLLIATVRGWLYTTFVKQEKSDNAALL